MLTSKTKARTMILQLLSSALLASVALASHKDSNYYPEGYGNPNVDRKMYWQDAPNVLEDLSKFSKLYVSYQNCA